MRRLGRRILRIQYDSYNWEEEVIALWAHRHGVEIEMVSPRLFGCEIDSGYPLLRQTPVYLRGGRIVAGGSPAVPDAVLISYSFELSDYQEGRDLFRRIVRSHTPQYSPFLSGLIAPKSTLVMLHDAELREQFLGKRRAKRLQQSLLPVGLLSDRRAEVKRKYRGLVLKHVDGIGGEQVYVGQEIPPQLKRIPRRRQGEWVVQQRIKPNLIEVDGFLSRPRWVMADLGVFVHFDWDGQRFRNFRMGGIITRATNRSRKVNVSGGGIQVPVMFARGR
jgi:hypothetical protein